MRKGLKRNSKSKVNKKVSKKKLTKKQEDVIVISDGCSSDSDIEIMEGGSNCTPTGSEKCSSTCSISNVEVEDLTMDKASLLTEPQQTEFLEQLKDVSVVPLTVSATQKGKNRRCFPAIEELQNVKVPSVKSCFIYTSQINKYRSKKDEAFLEIPALRKEEDEKVATHITAQEASLVADLTLDSNCREDSAPRRESKRKHNRTTKKLFSKLDQLKYLQHSEEISLDASLTEDCCEAPIQCQKDFIVRIRWKADILKFNLGSNEQFIQLMPQIAEKLEAPSEKIQLMLKDEFISLFQTPAEVNFRPGTIMDCYISGDGKTVDSKSTEKDPNTIELKLQSNVDRKKITLRCHKLQPLRKLMEDFAALKGLDAKLLHLKFDGDSLDLEETPHDLDMEEGDCLDIIVQS